MKGISQFPTLLEAFFIDRLMRQRQASPHTIASYRDTFRLLMQHAQQQLRKAPSQLIMPDLDTPFLGAFLDHLEQNRDNSARSRNVRLAAIHSFFRYVSLHAPEYNALAQRVLAMQSKRYVRRPICFLTPVEIEALLAAPDLNTWSGRRDRPCCHWPCRPDCAQQNSPACAVRTSPWVPVHTCSAWEKDAKAGALRFAKRPSQCCAVGCENVRGKLPIRSFRPHEGIP